MGKTLFFNSNGHGGYGDHDIFMSQRLDDSWTNWSEPVNVGEPINSPGYDFDFRLSPDRMYAYWASENGTNGYGDIFRLRLNSCEANVYPEDERTLCEGDTLVLQAGFSFFPGTEYQWYKNGSPIPGAIYRELPVAESGSYSFEKKMGVCESRSPARQVRFRTVPEISLSTPAEFLCEGDSILLWSGRQDNFSYQWKMNGLDIYGSNLPGHWATGPGSYSVLMSDGECTFESDPINMEQIPTPEIFLSGDILPTSASSLPKWLWTNNAPYQKGETSIHAIDADAQGNTFVLYLRQENGNTYEDLLKFYSEGPVSFQEPISNQVRSGPRFLSVDNRGNAIVARGYPYLSKYSPQGKTIWEIPEDVGQLCGLGTDAVGNIYTYGKYQKPIKLGDEAIVPASRGSVYLAKHSPEGELIWLKNYPVDGAVPPFGNALHVDKWGNVYIAGSFNGVANFRESVLKAPLRGESYFLAKFDTKGVFHWAKATTVSDNPGNTQDFFADQQGKSYLLLGEKLYSYSPEGNSRYEFSLSYSYPPNRIQMVAENDQVYLMGFVEKERMYFVNMVSTQGRMFSLWEGGKGEKGYPNQHAMGISPKQEVLVAGLSSGSNFPSAPLNPIRNSRFFTSKFGRPKVRPVNKSLSLCDVSPIYLLAGEIRGVQYQWLKDGNPIELGRSNLLEVNEPGNYQVRILGGSCENISSIQQVVSDCDQPVFIPTEPSPVVTMVQEDSRVEPEPVANPFEKDVPELERSDVGKPIALNTRAVIPQGHVLVKNATVKISLWDSELFDRDTVSLNINGEWVLEDYCLLPEKKELTYTFDKSNPHNFIILYAKNLGTKPPNTASMTIDDGIRRRTVQLRSTLKDCGTLEIRLNE